MELKYYMAILRRRSWVIVFTVLVATIASAVVSYSMTPQYKASTTIWVPTTDVSSDGTTGEIQLADRLINTYVTLATSGPVLRELEARTGIPAKDLKDVVGAESIAQTELMSISATDSDPQIAANIATSLSSILINQTLATKAGRDRRVSLFSPAGVPGMPIWMGLLPTPYWREINIVLGFVFGLIAAIALAFLYEYVDSTLYTREQIEATTELPTLVEIPVVRNAQPLIRYSNTLQSEAFRFLRTTIYFDHAPLPHTLLVTSALPGEGKSTVVANLAFALAQAKRKVILVDADLRLSTLHKFFGLSTDVGLSSILRQESTLQDALQQTDIPGLQVITSGPKADNPGEILDSPLMEGFLAQLRQEADFVLFDSPALLAVSDAVVISPLIAGVILVVGQAHAYQEAVRAAQSQLNAVGANLMGIVVNRADHVDTYFHRYATRGASTR